VSPVNVYATYATLMLRDAHQICLVGVYAPLEMEGAGSRRHRPTGMGLTARNLT